MKEMIRMYLLSLFLIYLLFSPCQAFSDCPPISSQSRNATVPNEYCAVEGPKCLGWGESGTYTDYLGNSATVTMHSKIRGSVSSIGGTNFM